MRFREERWRRSWGRGCLVLFRFREDSWKDSWRFGDGKLGCLAGVAGVEVGVVVAVRKLASATEAYPRAGSISFFSSFSRRVL
jgi:hypothetical protein